MTKNFAIAVMLSTLAGPVCGAYWKPVSVTRERSLYMDIGARARNGNVVQAWDWQKFSSPQAGSGWEGRYYWVKSLTNYHCTQRTTDAILKVYLGNDGVEIKRVHLEGLQFPASVEPDSVREKLLVLACNPPEPPATKPIPVQPVKEPEAKPDAKPDAKPEAKPDAKPEAKPAADSAPKTDPVAPKGSTAVVDVKSARLAARIATPAPELRVSARRPPARAVRKISLKPRAVRAQLAKSTSLPKAECPALEPPATPGPIALPGAPPWQPAHAGAAMFD